MFPRIKRESRGGSERGIRLRGVWDRWGRSCWCDPASSETTAGSADPPKYAAAKTWEGAEGWTIGWPRTPKCHDLCVGECSCYPPFSRFHGVKPITGAPPPPPSDSSIKTTLRPRIDAGCLFLSEPSDIAAVSQPNSIFSIQTVFVIDVLKNSTLINVHSEHKGRSA